MACASLMKCTHPPCQFFVDVDRQFCSPACAGAMGATQLPGSCGHAGCVGDQILADESDALTAE
jgi:hypothetical protein